MELEISSPYKVSSGMDGDEVKSLCILVVKEDLTCINIVAEILRCFKHQVLHTGGALDVLHAIWETKDRLHLVLTNADKLESSGTEIIQHIQKTLHLRVMSISLDKRKFESRGQPFSFEAFVLNGLSLNEVKRLWQIALGRERDKMVAARQAEQVQRASHISSSMTDAAHSNQKCKGVDLSEGNTEDHPTAKKQRVAWTSEKHKKFLEAIEVLGYENAVPKKIVEVMNDPELTRENVASHLQKYRLGLRRAQEISSLFGGSSTRNEFQGFLSSSLGTELQRRDYTCISGVEKLQQIHVPKFHFSPNFGIYEDQKRNMLLSIDRSSSSNMSKFVGYRFTGDGKSVGYGNNEASVDLFNAESFVSTSFQGCSISGIHGNHSPTGSIATSFMNMYRELASQKIGHEYCPFNLDSSTPLSITTSKQHISLHQIGESGNEEVTDKFFPLLDQYTPTQSWKTPANVPFQNPSDADDIVVQNASTPTSIFPGDQDFSIPLPGNDFPVQTSVAFLEGISEQYYDGYFDLYLEADKD